MRLFTHWVHYCGVLLCLSVAPLNCLSIFGSKLFTNDQIRKKNNCHSLVLIEAFLPTLNKGTLGAGHEAVMSVHFPLSSDHHIAIGCEFYCPEVIGKIMIFTTAPLYRVIHASWHQRNQNILASRAARMILKVLAYS